MEGSNSTLVTILQFVIPIIVALITSGVAYFQAVKKGKVEIDKLEKNHKNDLEKLIKQHEVNIDGLKEKHKLEMEAKKREYSHETIMLQLRSKAAMDEKTKELEGGAMYSVMGDVLKGVLSGEISAKNLKDLKEQFGKDD